MHNFFSDILKILSTFGSSVQMYCVDVLSTMGVPNRNYNSFSSVLGKSGVFIFFSKATNEVLYIGSSTGLYLSTGGPGAVAQLINTNNNAIYKHFLALNPNLATQTSSSQPQRNAYDNYINGYSVFFFCFTPTPTNQANFQADLIDIVTDLKSILNPTV